MKITVIVKPHASREKVEPLPDGSYRVSVHASPHEGKANEAVVEALAHFFKVSKSHLQIVHGLTGRKKIIEVL